MADATDRAGTAGYVPLSNVLRLGEDSGIRRVGVRGDNMLVAPDEEAELTMWILF